MEFDRPSTKYCFIAFAIFATLCFVFLFYMIFKTDSEHKAEVQKEINACKYLDLHYNDQVYVKDGFYKDVVFLAVEPGWPVNSAHDFESFKVRYYMSDSQEVLQFRCSDLVRY